MLDLIKSATTRTYEFVMGTAPPFSQLSESSHRHSKSSVDASVAQAALEGKEIRASDISSRGRAGTMQSATKPATMQYKTMNPMDDANNVIATLKGTITERDGDITHMRSMYTKLQRECNALKESDKKKDNIITEHTTSCEWLENVINETWDRYLRPYAQKTGSVPAEWTQRGYFDALVSLTQDAAESGRLQYQLHTLQKELLGRVEKVQVAPDDQFAQDFRAIVSLVRSLSRTIRIPNHLDVVAVLGYSYLQQNEHGNHWAGRSKKKVLIESWVWRALAHLIFRNPFAIYGEQFEILNATWGSMFFKGHDNNWPVPSALSETWRRTTTESMLNLIDREVITEGRVKDVPKKHEPPVIDTRKRVVSYIQTALGMISPDQDFSQVNNIVNKAFALAVHMSLQKFRLQLTYPTVGGAFCKGTMEHVPNLDGEELDSGTVVFVVNPGLTKWGDTHGKNFDQRYDIVPSLVQLEIAQENIAETEAGGVRISERGYAVAVPRPEDMKARQSYDESKR